jgi:hypothetical protein
MDLARPARLFVAAATAAGLATPAAAQSEPGATVVTHHETIPNPVFASTFRVAAACKSVLQPCAWEQPGTWTVAAVPGLNSRVIVDGDVRINGQTAAALSVGVYPGGTLSFSAVASTRLRTADLVVFAGGALEIGTRRRPIGAAVTAEVIIRDVAFSADPKQHLRGILVIDGRMEVHGRPLAETFLRTAEPPAAGQATVVVEASALAAGWKTGDAVVIPTSAQCPVASNGTCPDQTEDRTISAISADGRTLTLSSALAFDHPPARDAAGEIAFLPHVVNKGRNVVFRSENPAGVRGHVLLHGRALADIRYASIQSFGRTDIRDLGPANEKGRYPLHAHHLIGPASAPRAAHQFTLVGNAIDFGPENGAQDRKWGLTVHGSHYGLVERNVVDRASGAGLVTEDASETGNTFRRNFVLRIVGGNGARTEDRDPVEGSKLGRAGVAYWFNGGGGNVYEDNVAAAVVECTYCYGYKFDNVYNGNVTIPAFRGADPHQGQGVTVDSYTIGLTAFARNEAYAVPNGLTIWWVCTEFENPRDSCSSLVKDFRVWHHHRWGYFAYETNQMTVDGFVHRGDPDVLTNVHESVTGMFLVDYFQRRTVIRKADIQGAATGIVAPVNRDIRGTSGPDVGITRIEDSLINAGLGIDIAAPWSVNGSSNLAPQTTILRNVRFEYPATRQDAHIAISPDGGATTNLGLRNDVWIYDYDQPPGQDGDQLYIIPSYQPASRCDDTIGVCSMDVTASYPHLAGARVYPLR